MKKIIYYFAFGFLALCPFTLYSQAIVNINVYIDQKQIIKEHNSNRFDNRGTKFERLFNNDPVFQINKNEISIKNIPLLLYTQWTNKKMESVVQSLTDYNGKAIMQIVPEAGQTIIIEVNSGERKNPELNIFRRLVGDQAVSTHASLKEINLDIEVFLFFDGIALQAKKNIDILLLEIINTSITCSEIITYLNKKLHKDFLSLYPISAKEIQQRFLSLLESERRFIADNKYNLGDYTNARLIYEDLKLNFATSSFIEYYKHREDMSNIVIRDRKLCDSLFQLEDKISDNYKKIEFLNVQMNPLYLTDECVANIKTRIEDVQIMIAHSKKEEERNKMIEADANALKKYKVDLTYNQADFFANPFAFMNQNVYVTCIVEKFENNHQAIMRGSDYFYANYKIKPPKKLDILYLIVKVRGMTTINNIHGKIKVPLVDVVHQLNYQQ